MHPHGFDLDTLNWPVAVASAASWAWLDDLWHHLPGPTAIYMAVSAAFMLFQMFDKLGLLERFKRRSEIAELPELPKEH